MSTFLPFALPDIGEEEIAEVVDTLRSGWITTGPKVKRFEEDFKNYLGVPYALSVNSATAGLHLALDAIGVTRGDQVIVPTYTFTATAEVVRYFDAEPLFCDVDPLTYNMTPKKLEELLSREFKKSGNKIKAIMPVHMAGQACDMKGISEIAKRYDLKVIEDAAHAFPSTCEGRLIGTWSDITVFSFYATKTIATGEGGMIVTASDEYARRMKIMRLHGINRDIWDRYTSSTASWYYEVVEPGYKYNMPDIAAALGIHQLKKADLFFDRRNAIAQKYFSAFKDMESIKMPHIAVPSDKHSYHLFITQVDPKFRDEFIAKMKEEGVGLSVHFIPLHMQPYWKERYKLDVKDFPDATKAFSGAASLPIYTKMTDADVEKVVSATKKCLKR